MAGILALILAGVGGWFVWLPNFRPPLKPHESYGIDVSAYQGHIDWRRVAGQHLSFAYVKATEGATYVDPQFAANWSGASMADLPHGAYHFFSLCSPGLAQARNFLRVLPLEPGELAPAIDLELAGNCSRRPGLRSVQVQLSEFLQLVQHTTRQTVVIYLGADFAHFYHLPVLSRHPLWLRRFLRRPTGHWSIWQVDGNAHVAGIHGDVDLDVGRLRLGDPNAGSSSSQWLAGGMKITTTRAPPRTVGFKPSSWNRYGPSFWRSQAYGSTTTS